MKIAIISDIHDHLLNLNRFMAFAKKEGIALIILCGDICHLATLQHLFDETRLPVYISLGNGDFEKEYQDIKNEKIKVFDSLGEITIDNLNIGFSHFKKNLALSKKKNDFFFYGHTHQPWIEEINGVIVANPGNLSDQRYQATFALLETKTKKLELKILALHA